ncbi:SA0632 family lipoprotein [Staphylococcus equorum]|uniref:SA0632 family lipoprotein n=1 Tax=Staphylococcus equorum TaxID=246432 RepID=UPI003FD81FF4
MKKCLALILASTIALTACGKDDEKASLEKDIDKLEKKNKDLKKEKLEKEQDKLQDQSKDLEKEINAET